MGIARSLRRVTAVMLKELKHIWFDPGFLFLTVLSPAVLLTLLAYVFSFDVETADIAIVDYDQSATSFEYIRSLTASGDLNVIARPGSYSDVIQLIQDNSIDGAIIIPPNFNNQLEAGNLADVNVVIDGSDPTVGVQLIGSIEQRTQAYSWQVIGLAQAPFDIRTRVWFNPNLSSQHSMIPGLMALVLILPAMSVALGVTREKETGTFETLVTTPIRGREYLLGKLAVYLILALIGTLPALGVAVFWFEVPFRGNLLLYMGLTGVYIFAIMGMCLVIAHFVSSQRTAISIVLLLLFIPGFFLTGLTIPVDESAQSSYIVSQMLPVTHYIIISRGVTLKALPLTDLLREAILLTGMGTIAVTASLMLFRKKI
ncbi:MAG: ABC transporter permease [Chloroflexi bacterium]|nr:ABC transporter permease [Chloroflexota bacterium]